MFSRKPFVMLATMMLATGLFFALEVFAADNPTAGLGSLSVQATGTETTRSALSGGCTTPSFPCPSNHACFCMTGSYSIKGNNAFNGGTASLTLRIDLTNLGDTITAIPSCAPAGGVGTISNKKGNNTITFFTSGQACETQNGSTVNNGLGVFAGAYVINGGTGKYSSATGAGTIGSSGSFLGVTDTNPIPSQASFNGTVQP